MPEPKIEVVGVYRLEITEELLQEQFEILYGYDVTEAERREAKEHCRNQLKSIVLIEVIVRNRDNKFNISDFTQGSEDEPVGSWQVAWAEAFLTMNGESLAVERWSDPPETGDLRIAFFIHYWDANKPLSTSYGDIFCPPPGKMPERLKKLVPYEPVD
jgi:hypothetical protein